MQPNFEYKVEKLDDLSVSKLETHLNTLGQEAWELIGTDGVIFFFKRKQLNLIQPYSDSRPQPEIN